MAFDMFANGFVQQVGNPANGGPAVRDPSGQMFLMLSSTTPQMNAFFVSWNHEIVEIDRFRGVRVIGGCQFQPGVVPPPPYVNVYQPPVMHQNLGVMTPQGFMPIPQAIANPNQPFAQPMITGEGQAQQCYQRAWSPTTGLNRERFGECMVVAMSGQREAAVFNCMRSRPSADARAICMVGALGGDEERRIAQALDDCVAQYGSDYSRYPLCMSGTVTGGDAGRLLACVEQQSRRGEITPMGTALCYGAQDLDLNPEMQIVVQCAVATGGDPYTFTGCAGGQLAARELDKCLTGGVGGPDGCFGPNNDIIRGLRNAGVELGNAFGPNNDIVRTWNNAVNDLTQGPGPGNDAVRVIQNVGNEIARAPGNVAKAVERALPRITVRF